MSEPRRRRPLLALAVLAATGAACSPRGEPTNRVLHLDPRLPDGRSPAAVLAGREVVVRDVRARDSAASLAPWRLEGASARRGKKGGLELVGAGPGTGAPASAARLVLDEPLEAGEVNVVELELRAPGAARTRLAWRTRGTGRATPFALEKRVTGSPDFQTLRFELGREPGWQGAIAELVLEPARESARPCDVRRVRLLRRGFAPGAEPSDPWNGEGIAGADEGGSSLGADGGLVAWGLEARRAWPSDLGVALEERARLPRGARLSAWFAPAYAGALDGVRVAVELRRPDGDWQTVVEEPVPAGPPAWSPLRADLARWAGGEVELRFTARAPAAARADRPEAGELERARVLWGSPLVLGEPVADRRPDVVLVTLDTLRADAVNPRDTPFLARLAADGVAFDDAWSACNATTPSHASILTGLHVQDHGAYGNQDALSPRNVTLAERFRAAGYQTAAAVSVGHLEAGTGLGQGFDRFRQAHTDAHTDGALTLEPVLDWLRDWREEGERPVFLWVHLFDPHTPYGPPEAFLEAYHARLDGAPPTRAADPATIPAPVRGPRAAEWVRGLESLAHARYLYAAGAAYADHLAERLWSELEASDALDHTALALTSDHGESLGEHAIWFEHKGLFRETLRVPLLLRLPPGGRDGAAGVRVASRVTTLDLAPTLLDFARLDAGAELRGRSLLPLLRGASEPPRTLWFEHSRLFQVGCLDGETYFITTVRDGLSYGLVTDGADGAGSSWERIPAGTSYLFDYGEDPELARDRAADEPERVAAELERVERWSASMRPVEHTERDLSPDERARLEELGYLGDE